MKNQNEKQESKTAGEILVPLLLGLGVVIVVLGILLFGGRKPIKEEEGSLEGVQSITVLPTQEIVIGNQKMFLEVNSPTDGAQVSTNKITVSGQTMSKAEVSVNEKDLVADDNGNFSTTVSLEEGENFISITAGNENGFEEKEIVVYFEK